MSLPWISERVHLDSLDDGPWHRLKALADDEGMDMGDYVVQYGPDNHVYTFSDEHGQIRLDREESMKIAGTINGRKPQLFAAQLVDEEGLWIDREGIGPVAIFPDGSVYIYEEEDSDADPVIVRTPLDANPTISDPIIGEPDA